VVIAGSTDAINQAQKIITSDTYKGGKALLLAVSAPFHSPLMKPARDRMSEIFKKEHTQVKPLSVSYIPNRTARLTQESSVVLELLAEQVDHPVLWRTSMETAFSNGYTKVIEFGPGKVLQGLAKRIAKPKEIEIATLGISAAAQIKELEPHV
jgi:[acyl-carrier-protein] S-malonyltransferase